MEKLTCEMCGSTNIIKEDGLWTCQSCGAKYSPEEAKRMMVEGTVQIDYSSKIDNNRILLDRAIKNLRWEDVKKYSDEILSADPEDYQSIFYKELAECWISKMDDYKEGYDIIDAVDEVIGILKRNNSNAIGFILVQYSEEIFSIVGSIQSTASEIRSEEKDIVSDTYFNPIVYASSNFEKERLEGERKAAWKKVDNRYNKNIDLCVNLLSKVIDFYHEYSEEMKSDEKLKKEKENFDYDTFLLVLLIEKYELMDIHFSGANAEKKKVIEEIRKYDSSYGVEPEVDNNYTQNYSGPSTLSKIGDALGEVLFGGFILLLIIGLIILMSFG